MRDQATRMSRLIDDLLSLSRIEMKAHLRPSGEVDLVSTVRHVADALEPLARELGVAIATDLPQEPVMVAGDRDELIQVIENLIENACKYGQSGGKVEVTVDAGRRGGGAVLLGARPSVRASPRSTCRGSPSASTGSRSMPAASIAAPVSASPSSSTSSPGIRPG